MDKQLKSFIKKKNDDAVVRMQEATVRDGEYTKPYSIGMPDFDEPMKGGVRAGDLFVLTGISGHGKTTVAQNISVNMKDLGPSLWFSYEVLIDNLYAKFKEMGVDKGDVYLYTPKRNTSGNLKWVTEKTKEAIESFNTRFVFIDHIDFLSPTNINSTDQRRMLLRDICQELKNLAVECEITIFLIAHVKKVQGREVEMQDIAESSGIYQLADYVLLVGRKTEMVKPEGEKKQKPVMRDEGFVRFLKNRLTGQLADANFTLENNKMIWSAFYQAAESGYPRRSLPKPKKEDGETPFSNWNQSL